MLLSTALVALLLAISKGGSWGWTDPRTLIVAAVAVLSFAVWFPLELWIGRPLVDLRAPVVAGSFGSRGRRSASTFRR